LRELTQFVPAEIGNDLQAHARLLPFSARVAMMQRRRERSRPVVARGRRLVAALVVIVPSSAI
jgi:hypothetical protein